MAFNWKSIEGYFSYEAFYLAVIDWLDDGDTFVELGTLYGKSIARAAEYMRAKKKKLRLVTIDHGVGGPTPKDHILTAVTFIENMDRLNLLKHMTPIISDSAAAASFFADGSVDFLYIDASHEYEFVHRDIVSWLPKIKIGGIISGHDYNGAKFPGVKRAVDEIFGFEAFVTEFKGGVWAVVKENQDCQVRFAPLRERPDFLKT